MRAYQSGDKIGWASSCLPTCSRVWIEQTSLQSCLYWASSLPYCRKRPSGIRRRLWTAIARSFDAGLSAAPLARQNCQRLAAAAAKSKRRRREQLVVRPYWIRIYIANSIQAISRPSRVGMVNKNIVAWGMQISRESYWLWIIHCCGHYKITRGSFHVINCRLIRLTSPNLNYLIGVGAIILYLDISLSVIPITDVKAVTVLCNVSFNASKNLKLT